MYYKPRRQASLSQNFLRNPQLVTRLIGNSSIGNQDVVLEIGPGKGIITSQLQEFAGKVIAIEKDYVLFKSLMKKFHKSCNLELIHSNFLNYQLPDFPYKVFANIPFIITADILKKLTSDSNFQEGYLIIQKDAAKKFIGMPFDNRNQMMSVLLKPWFDISVYYKFLRTDFSPIPRVDVLMIRIIKISDPLVEKRHSKLYKNFVLHKFNSSKVSRIAFRSFMFLFNEFLRRNDPNEINLVNQQANKILISQSKLHKVHRTRKDKNWKKYDKL